MRVRDVDFGKAVIEWPQMVNGFPTVHQDDQSSFSSQEIDEKLDKGVDCEGLLC